MNMLVFFILAGIWGCFVGAYAAIAGFSVKRMVITSTIGVIVIKLLIASASAAELPTAVVKLRESAVHIDIGSGSIVEGKSGKHYILTNWHVCNSARWKGSLYATYNEGPVVVGPVVKMSPTKDLCVARVDSSKPALKLAPRILPRSEVYTRGWPEGILTESHGRTLGDTVWEYFFNIQLVGECPKGFNKERSPNGNVVGCTGSFESTLTNLYGRPGSSGSPVVNSDGELVGVISSWHPESDYEAGMVTYKQVKEFLSDL